VTARRLDGRALAAAVTAALPARVARLPRPPGLAVVRVGDDPASAVYVHRKAVTAQKLGFHQRELVLPPSLSQAALLALVDELNADPAIDGILVQLPLPPGLRAAEVFDRIDPTKDVDGFHPDNVGRLSQGRPRFVPCTPLGVLRLLEADGTALAGAEAVVVGRSDIVGRPMAMLLEQRHATVTICHSRTRDLAAHLARAEVLVVAIGRPHAIPGAWIREGATVIDVGINRGRDGGLCGDVHPSAADRAAALTPVPGGVGPMTIAMLMENTVRSAEARLTGV
jgi:methylenetetrahydrofolate dehydrogenase (NADP+)/methenyltetrahydrofolate cyclohydrolase